MAAERTAMGRNLFLYRRLLVQHLKSVLEYETDFWVLVVGSVAVQATGIVAVWALFRQIPDIQGWQFWDIVLMYSLVYLTEGVNSLFFQGMWWLAWAVHQGELDIFLVRPVSPILQVVTSQIGMDGLGNIAMGSVLLTLALGRSQIAWSPGRVAMALVMLVSAMVIRIAINLASNSSSFWTRSPSPGFAGAVHALADFGKFPLNIYAMWVRTLVVVGIPFAFVSFFPAAYVLDRGDWSRWALLTPLVAVWALAASLGIFRAGLRRYESTGT